MSPARAVGGPGDQGIDVTIVRGGTPDDAALVAIARAIAELDARRGSGDARAGHDTAWSSAGRFEAVEGRRIRTHDGIARPGRAT